MSIRTPTVIVADDDAGIRELLEFDLSRLGFQVLLAADGKAAIELLMRAPEVTMVLMDLVMPGQEGLETIRTVKQRWPGVHIVAMSGAFDGRFLEVARKLGADRTLAKPFDVNALRAALGTSLETRLSSSLPAMTNQPLGLDPAHHRDREGTGQPSELVASHASASSNLLKTCV